MDNKRLEVINKAYDVWWLDFVLLLNAENWEWTTNRVHLKPYYRNWKKYNDHWLCWISDYYYKEIVENPRFTDPDYQIQECYRLYKWWTKFYWNNIKHRYKNQFIVYNN